MCVEFRRVFNIFLGTSQYCSASTVAGLGMQDKIQPLPCQSLEI